jgi:hypothetical protein
MSPQQPNTPVRRAARGVFARARAGGCLGAALGGFGVALGCATSPPPASAVKPASTAPAPVVAAASVGAAPAPAAPADAGGLTVLVANAQRSQVVPPDLGTVERMCALLTSCDKLPIPPSLIPDDFASCVKKMSDEMSATTAINFSLTLRECGLQSDSCASLRACAMRGASVEACGGRGKQGVVGFCDVDGRALTCWHDQALSVRDCPRGGEQCLVLGGQATCTLGPCPATMAEGDKPRCSPSGTHLLHCEKGKLASLDCATFGLKCSTAADGASGCATAGPACAAGTNRCEGNVAVGCFNGHEVRVDCGAAGFACNQAGVTGTGVGACVAPPVTGSACDPNASPKCDDTSIRYCAAGRPRVYSCKAAGFARCDSSRGPVHCAP